MSDWSIEYEHTMSEGMVMGDSGSHRSIRWAQCEMLLLQPSPIDDGPVETRVGTAAPCRPNGIQAAGSGRKFDIGPLLGLNRPWTVASAMRG